MTRIKDPKQVASTIRQILLILMRSSSVCFMAGHGETEGRGLPAEPRTAGLCLMLMVPLAAAACVRVSMSSAQLPGVRCLPPRTRLLETTAGRLRPLAEFFIDTLWKKRALASNERDACSGAYFGWECCASNNHALYTPNVTMVTLYSFKKMEICENNRCLNYRK